jgi:predicted RNA methylase
MLALWKSSGNIRKDPEYILADINQACASAFWAKPELAVSLRVDVANETLAVKARRIVAILERLNITVLTAEHDYLGQLYEEFFRYTGGNTIGQYFTPRHVANFMADLVDVSASDVVLDPACGTGGFLIAAMNNIMTHGKLSRSAVVKLIKKQLIGFDKEPVTAALCIANMILRGDGSSGVHKGDAFTSPKFPKGQANVVLMNPPFPHKKTDTPPERFIERALEGLQQRGRMAVIVPRSMLAKRDKAKWRSKILTQNRLDGVIVLPDELFMPYASSYTAVLLMTKGVAHPADHAVFFARVENDGFRLRKGVRVARNGDELPKALDAYKQRLTTPGFSGWTKLDSRAGWDPGYYIPPRPLSEEEVAAEAGALVRSRAAFVVKHAVELEASLAAIDAGQLTASDYRKRKGGAPSLLKPGATIGEHFEIFYGQKSLHSKEKLSPGKALVISSSGSENGSYGFFDFLDLIEPPFVTVPSTGSIGQAHVQEWPCGVTDDCLLLFPMENVPHELLYVAAAVIRRERWRFNYGMKITPMRIARFPLPFDEVMLARVREHLEGAERIEKLALSDAEDATDAEAARTILADPKGQGRPVMGDELRQRLKRCLT